MVVINRTHIMLQGAGTTNGNDNTPAPPANCAALGTCASCTDVAISGSLGCGRSNPTFTRTNCAWVAVSVSGTIVCSNTPTARWILDYKSSDEDHCVYFKLLTSCPPGSYARTANACGDCPATLDIYAV